MFELIRQAYRLGMKYAALAENVFFFGHKLTSDNTQYLFPREAWDSEIGRIKNKRARFGLVERLFFELGDDSFTLSHPASHVPVVPYNTQVSS